jgi:hypothetical protein
MPGYVRKGGGASRDDSQSSADINFSSVGTEISGYFSGDCVHVVARAAHADAIQQDSA